MEEKDLSPLELQELDRNLDIALFGAKAVSPKDRHQLRHLLRHYAKKKHPFTACVRDNTKRFGVDGAKEVCATLKDVIKGTTKWRKGRQTGLSEIDDNIVTLQELMKDEGFAEFVNDWL
jgi:hypothetical protein